MRAVFDITALFEVKANVTGISRTMLHFIEHVTDNPNYTELGLMRHSKQTGAYTLVTPSEFEQLYDKICANLQCYKKELIISDAVFCSSDVFFLLGEQWLNERCIQSAAELKNRVGGKLVVLVYDLVPFFAPEYYWHGFPEQFIETYRDYFEHGDYFLCISECTRRDFLKYAREHGFELAEKTAVFRLGDVFERQIPQTICDVPDDNYCLYVSTVQPRKNHYLLYYAWLELYRLLGDKCPSLVLVGTMGWNVDNLIFFLKETPQIKDKVYFLNPSSDSRLVDIYKKCFLNLYVSFYEGWGLPVAEASSLGKYSIVSEASSLPEIAGALVEYHSPYDPIALAQKIANYVQNPAALKQKEQNLKEKFRPQTWKHCTQEMLSLVRDYFASTDAKELKT